METFWTLVSEVLRIRTDAVESLVRLEGGGRLALVVVLLAGLSDAVGKSAVLFVNRVRARRFLLSLLVATLVFAFTYAFWTASIHLVARFAFGADAEFGTVARLVGFGYAPRLFAFLAFLPFLGGPIAAVLQVWSLLAVLAGVEAALAVSPWEALACVALGAAVLLVSERTVGRPLTALSRWLRRRAAGVDLVTDPEGLRALVEAGPDGTGRGPAPTEERRERTP